MSDATATGGRGAEPRRADAAGEPLGALLGRARLGDRAAFAELHQRYAQDVARLARRLLGPGPDAEDAASETFLRLQEAFAGYDPARPFRRWLLAIAAHRCIDRLRRQQREGRLFEDGELVELAADATLPSPLGAALAAEQRARIAEALAGLSPGMRAALTLRFLAELSYAEIGAALELDVGRVGVLLHRGRVRLRRALEAQEDGP